MPGWIFVCLFFFTEGVVNNWNRMPREVVELPSVGVFKIHLDMAHGDLV